MAEWSLLAVKAFLGAVKEAHDPDPAPRTTGLDAILQSWARLSLNPGDRVLFALPNCPSLLDHLFGAWLAGLVPALVSPSNPPGRMAELIRHLQPRAVVSLVPALRRHGCTLASVGGATVLLFPYEGCSQPMATTQPGETILMTSGTSGLASGCLFDLGALMTNASRHADAVGQKPGEGVLVSLPLFYSFALVAQALAAFQREGRLWIASQPFHPETYLGELATTKAAMSSLTPVQARRMGVQPWPKSLRALTVGGDALEVEAVKWLLAQRPGRELYLTYGTTPAGPRISTLAAHQANSAHLGSVGLPLVGTHVRTRPAQDLPSGGELLVQSNTLMKRRVGMIEGRGDDWACHGILATGDGFEIDAEGYLQFRGRLSDFVVMGGEKVCLASVRRLAVQCPGVLSAKTLPRKEGYELTVVVESSRAQVDVEDFLRRNFSLRERPRKVRVVQEKVAAGELVK